MDNNLILTIFIGGFPEALYFSLFMIFAKDIKEHRIKFALSVISAYVGLGLWLIGSIWFNVSFIFALYAILKLFYRDKAGIVDVFVYMISCLLYIIAGMLVIPLYLLGINTMITALIAKTILVAMTMLCRKNIRNISIWYRSVWNRDNNKSNIKSLTIRHASMIMLNGVIIFLHFGILILIFIRSGGM